MASPPPARAHPPPDHSKGDESTIGGYMAVHDRPAAFEGSDGFSYSVEIMTDDTGDARSRWGAFFLFVQWSRIGAQTPEGHLETRLSRPRVVRRTRRAAALGALAARRREGTARSADRASATRGAPTPALVGRHARRSDERSDAT